MLPWKRSELWFGTSAKEFNEILDLLSANHVEYQLKTGGDAISARNMSPRTEVMGRWGENPVPSVTYTIFVKKEQLEYARQLISQQK